MCCAFTNIWLPQKGKHIVCFDPSFLPSLKSKGHQGVVRHSKVSCIIMCIAFRILIVKLKGQSLLDCDVLIFPIHKPFHWSVVVGKRS